MRLKTIPAEVVNAYVGLLILFITLIAATVTSYFVIGWLGLGINPGFFIGIAVPFTLSFFMGNHPYYVKTVYFYWFKYDGTGFPDDTYLSEEQKSGHSVINACTKHQKSKKKEIKSLLDD